MSLFFEVQALVAALSTLQKEKWGGYDPCLQSSPLSISFEINDSPYKGTCLIEKFGYNSADKYDEQDGLADH